MLKQYTSVQEREGEGERENRAEEQCQCEPSVVFTSDLLPDLFHLLP